MTHKDLADLIFPHITKTIEDYEKMYPERNLPEGAIVTRFAPSPTGFVHMGSLLASFIERKAAKDTNGVFYLRIEDTDQKREVENGIEGIVTDLKNFKIDIDEGALSRTESIGNYGPYIQSERKEIYQAFIKHLLELGLAYPCFCTAEMLDETREMQEATKARIGYYGRYAVCRNIKLEDAYNRIKNGEKYIIRLKSPGDFEKKVVVQDAVKGKIEFPENDLDIVIMKSDGLPTYHFAHLVDDHLMRTTHVIRGDEWVSSLPIHVQLFKMFGFNPPKYAHLSPIMKQEGDTKRKLSKRKDPEAAMSYYAKLGIPTEAVHLYLMTIANTNFEQWYDQNKDKSIDDFKFDFKKISSSGALFDLEKLINISRNYISYLKAEDVYDKVLSWAQVYDNELSELLSKYKEYTISLFGIERYQKKPRKDFESWSTVKDNIWYMYDELFTNVTYDFQKITDKEEIKNILDLYINKYYNELDEKDTWFNKIKELCDELGYASNMKDYKENPNNYKGNIADVSTVIRVVLTSSSMTPDLYELMKLLGIIRIKERINKFIEN
ncbi:MAG: glutamate--tRNA ligase [Bacilli bacterium]|nr:glutamate--tRNA ligase [Bacilli bacterium]MBQ9854531.1 glutamate--tRNA ligase [Bacilli bacterium]